jgi:hypothetical protein
MGVYIDWAILNAKISKGQSIPKGLFERLKLQSQYNPIAISDLLVFETCLASLPLDVKMVLM